MMIDRDISPNLTGKWEQTREHIYELSFCNNAYLVLNTTMPDCPTVQLKSRPWDDCILNIRISSEPLPLDELKRRAVETCKRNCELIAEIHTKLLMSLNTIKITGE